MAVDLEVRPTYGCRTSSDHEKPVAHADSVATGFESAKNVVREGRAKVFGSVDFDLPKGSTPKGRAPQIAANDLVPQFGFVGPRYASSRILILGINPGNGPDDRETAPEAEMMPSLRAFASDPSQANFASAQSAYRRACESWSIWDKHCIAILNALGAMPEDIAYSNCLPWRTASNAAFLPFVAQNAADLYAGPLITELAPRVIVAAGKKAAAILTFSRVPLPEMIVWNRAQALTPMVSREREVALAQLRTLREIR